MAGLCLSCRRPLLASSLLRKVAPQSTKLMLVKSGTHELLGLTIESKDEGMVCAQCTQV